MSALGEMITFLPIPGGHITLAHRFVSPAWGFALSFCYAFLWLIIFAAELSASAVLINYVCRHTGDRRWIDEQWITSVNNAGKMCQCGTKRS